MRRALAAIVMALAAGCASQPRPVTTVTPALGPAPGVPVLQAELDALFAVPAFSNAIWGVLVRSLKNGDTLYQQHAGTFLMPASNMKVVTMAVAAERLGWDFTFTTTLLATGPIEHGVLKGDLVVVGSGDPSFGGRPPADVAVFDAWADELRAKGITAIEGRIVGDDHAFDAEGLGAGWAWDYLSAGYATPVGALDYNENVVQVTLTPGPVAGAPAIIETRPDTSALVVDNRVRTVAAGGESRVESTRLPGSRVLRMTGTVPIGRTDVTRTVSVDNPTELAVLALRRVLSARGIPVGGDAIDIDELAAPPDLAGAQTLARYTSAPLSQIGKVMLKVSQNLYADTLLKTLGKPARAGPASTAAGATVVQDTLKGWGIAPDRYVMMDGSGLSRYNYLTPDVLVTILTRMASDDRHKTLFADALPVAGVDGTIAGRMKNTKAQGNARAKTGSISNARALSGYVTSADGEPLVFSMIVNNFNVPQSDADAVIDRAVVRLAEFRRR